MGKQIVSEVEIVEKEEDEIEIPDLFDLFVRTEILPREEEFETEMEIISKSSKESRCNHFARMSDRIFARELYLASIVSYQRITEEENRQLAREFQASKNLEIRNQIILGNLSLVLWYAKTHLCKYDFNDCVQWAAMGLISATEKWLPDFVNGTVYGTYGVIWMRQMAHRAYDEFKKTIRIPAHICVLERKVETIYKQQFACSGKFLSIEDLTTEVNRSSKIPYSVQQVYRVFWSLQNPDVSLGHSDCNVDQSVYSGLNPEQILLARAEVLEACDQIKSRVFDRLPLKQRRDRAIFQMRYGLDGTGRPKNLRKIGRQYGITGERVRQIIKKVWKVFRWRRIPENENWLKAQARKIKQIEDVLGEDISADIFVKDHPTETKKVLKKDFLLSKKSSRFIVKEKTVVTVAMSV